MGAIRGGRDDQPDDFDAIAAFVEEPVLDQIARTTLLSATLTTVESFERPRCGTSIGSRSCCSGCSRSPRPLAHLGDAG